MKRPDLFSDLNSKTCSGSVVPSSEPQNAGCRETLINQATLRCEESLKLAEAFFNTVLPVPRLRFDIRGRAAGQFRAGRSRKDSPELRFNPSLLIQQPEAFMAEVVPHEVAHLVAYTLYGPRIKPHGREWQGVMMEVYGLEPQVTHTFEVPDSGRFKYQYVCGCEGRVHYLSGIRHQRIQQKTSQYTCKDCRRILSPPA